MNVQRQSTKANKLHENQHQITLPHSDLCNYRVNALEVSDDGPGADGAPPQVDAGNVSATVAGPPAWLGNVEQSLGIHPGNPLSPLALVQRPPQVDDAISWTLETTGHRGAVNAAVYSPDGKRIATAGEDGTVRIINADSDSTDLPQVVVCPGPVKVLAWSQGGMLATAQHGPEDSICVWQLGERVKLVTKIHRKSTQLAWSPDEKYLAFNDNGVQLWQVESNELIPNFGMTGSIGSRPWSANGNLLATVDQTTGAIRIWDVPGQKGFATFGESYRTPPTFATQGHYVAALHAPPDPVGERGRTGRSDAAIHVWDIDRNQRVKDIVVGKSYMESFAWSHDGTKIAVMHTKNPTLWDVKTGQKLDMHAFGMRPASGRVRQMQQWSPGNQHLLAVRQGRLLRWDAVQDSWDQLVGPNVEVLTDRRRDMLAVRYFLGAEVNSNGYLPSRIHIQNLRTSERIELPGDDVAGFSLSPDGSRIALVGPQPPIRNSELANQLTMQIFDTASGELLVDKEYEATSHFGLQWSPTGDKILLRQISNDLVVVDASSGVTQQKFEASFERPAVIRGRSFHYGREWHSPGYATWLFNGDRIAWQPNETTLAISDVKTGETVRELDVISEEIKSANESRSDGREEGGARGAFRGGLSASVLRRFLSIDLITASSDGRWLAATRTLPRSPSNRSAARVNPQVLLIWNLDRPEKPVHEITFSEESGGLVTIDFSPDGNYVALRHADNVLGWHLESGNQVLKESVNDLKEVLGWISPTQLACYIAVARDTNRISMISVDSDTKKETTIYANLPYRGEFLRGDRLHVIYGNVLQIFDKELQLVRTQVYDHEPSTDGDDALEVVEVRADGESLPDLMYRAPFAVTLSEQGQQTLPYDEFLRMQSGEQ